MQPTFRPVRAGGAGFSIFVICFLLAGALTLAAWIFYKRGMATPPPVKASVNTNANPLARASQTLGAVQNLNREGAVTAENMPAATVNSAAVDLKLQGIFFSANNPSAIINGKSMKVGDEADGIKVLEITEKLVRVRAGGQTRELTMK